MVTDQSGTRGRRRWGRIFAWVGAGLGVVIIVLAAVIVTAPRWAAQRLEAELEQRVGRRLDARVEIGTLEASWSGAELRHVSVVMSDLEVEIDTLELAIDRSALWSARIEVTQLDGVGGNVAGTRAGFEDLATRLGKLRSPADDDARSWWRRRLHLTPDILEVRGIAFVVTDGQRRVTGSLQAHVEPKNEEVDLEVSSLLAEVGLGRPLQVSSLRTQLIREGGSFRFPLTVEVAGLAAELDENIAVAGVHGSVTAEDARASEISVNLAGGFSESNEGEISEIEGQDLWSVEGRFARDLSSGKVAVEMAAFELGRVPEVLARLPLVESEQATVGGELELAFGEGIAEVDGELELAGLNLSHRLLARDVVRDVGFSVALDAHIDPAARRVTLESLSVTRGGVELRARGELVHAREREKRRYQLSVDVPEVRCQAVLDAIPRELVPGLVGFELDGRFSAALTLDADFAKLDELVLEGMIGIEGCEVRAAPHLASARRLESGFVHRVTMRDGRTRRIPLYSGSSSYTSLDGISRYMTEAVLTTEDGSFRRHDGFNRTQLEVALRRNLQSGKVRIGASTITMQMVKNVLLSHERTLSRKLQELFLTWWVEESLSKQRIMELYLNVIEFGPGVYGVSNASRHYFGKHPGELTSLEAAYLAAMLPSPVRRHVHYCNGELSERFDRKVYWVHDLMLERDRITPVEHEIYAAMGLHFDVLERGVPELCLEEIETLMAGTHTQRALSGLLGDGDSEDSFGRSGDTHPASRSWGVRPPLPDPTGLDFGALEGLEGGEGGEFEEGSRLEPSDEPDWRVPTQPIDADPANSDAPGRPAMDE